MDKKKPVNLELRSIKLPVTAYASILHRISGFVMIFIIAFLLYVLSCSLSTEESYDDIFIMLHTPWIKFIVWIILSVISYHFIAGFKHIIMDAGFCEEKQSGKIGAIISFIVTIVAVVFLGVWMIW